jgi:pimeloyl-ACP methyl ester carboxylesterase
LTRNSSDFEALAPKIAALGRRVVAIDVRGRGKSDRDPAPERYQPSTYVQDALSILDALEIERAVFIGTSMGGLMTMIAAVTAPQRISAAVLNDIGPVVDSRGLQRIASYVGKGGAFESWSELIEAIKEVQAAIFPDAGEEFWITFARRVARERDDGKIEFDYDPSIARAFEPGTTGSAVPPDLLPLFSALAARPVLVIRGSLSDILAPGGIEAMRAVKPDLKIAEVPRVGHAPTLDEPTAWEAISAFLAQVE